MRNERVFDELTEVSDEYIIEAMGHILKKSRAAIIRWCVIAAVLLTITGIGAYLFFSSGLLPFLGGGNGG
ncbi:MAG: DUF3352 domain-containing protein [Oscillospiraceae bacterium]|nr:DUF3352 domain-containing protein [Oscillospiraceae bacterium]